MAPQTLGDFGHLSLSVVVSSPPWFENCFIVGHKRTGEAIVVDPGDEHPRIRAALEELSLKPLAIWLTHGHPDHLGAARALERAFGVFTRAHADEAALIAMAGRLNRAFGGHGFEGPVDLDFFHDEPNLSAGSITAHAIHTPGHTPGGVCYDFGGFALTGDTLFKGGVGRTDLPGGNEETLSASITRLLGHITDDTVLFSGHGPAWTAREAREWWREMA